MAVKKRSAARNRTASKAAKSNKKKAATAKARPSARAAGKGRAGGRTGNAAKKRASSKPLKQKAQPARKARKAPAARASASAAPKRGRKTGRAGAAKRGSTGPKRTGKARAAPPSPKPSVEKQLPRPSNFSAAVKLYENALKSMHAEKFDRAKALFEELIAEYPEETELLDRANVLLQVCEKRLSEARKPPKLRGADDYYEIGVAEMNRRELDRALEHLEHALKLEPKGDHIFYALAAASALAGKRGDALEYLKKSIHYREENRYLAVNDIDFESLAGDPDFQKLVTHDRG